jgi:hypothetical protein
LHAVKLLGLGGWIGARRWRGARGVEACDGAGSVSRAGLPGAMLLQAGHSGGLCVQSGDGGVPLAVAAWGLLCAVASHVHSPT